MVVYPTLPPWNLCLNEGSFPPLGCYVIGYRPLFWCHFGGPGGKYLSHLTGISVAFWAGIFRIHFSFDKEVPAEHQGLGRRKSEYGTEDVIDFSIDGPGGERIEIIKMDHYYPHPDEGLPWVVQEGFIARCKVYIPVPDFVPVKRCSPFHLSSSIQTAGDHAFCCVLPSTSAKAPSFRQRSKPLRALSLAVFMLPRYVGLNPENRLLQVTQPCGAAP